MADPRAVAAIREQAGLEPMAVLGMEVMFAPRTRFAQVWERSFAPALAGKSRAEKAAIREAVYAALKGIDLSEGSGPGLNPLRGLTEAEFG